jgi:hypothetical protein
MQFSLKNYLVPILLFFFTHKKESKRILLKQILHFIFGHLLTNSFQKKLLDQIHQIEDPQADTQSDLLEKIELTKLRRNFNLFLFHIQWILVANEKESIDRAEEIRNRLRREATKRGYLGNSASQPEPSSVEIPETNSDQRVPPVVKDVPTPPADPETSKAE